VSKRPCGVKHSDAIKRGLAAKKIRTNGIKRLTKERDAAMAEVERLRAALRDIATGLGYSGHGYFANVGSAYEVARAALSQPAATGEGAS